MAEWAFIDHVTDHMARPRRGEEKHPTQWPSEATAIIITDDGHTKVVGKCRRAAFFRLLVASYKFYDKYNHWKHLVEQLQREQTEVDRYMRWIWAQGNLYEEYLIQEAQKSNVYVDDQVRIYIKSHNVSGSIDIEVINPRTHLYSIVESKSVYGFGSDFVLGSQYDRNQGRMGTPKDSNIMQILLYHWWKASEDSAYEDSRLVYGSRDTGRYGEFLVRTVKETDENNYTTYWGEWKWLAPYEGEWQRTKITINSILECYKYIQQCIDTGVIPERDFNAKYSDEELVDAFMRDQLNKTDTTKMEKYLQRMDFNNWVETIPELSDEELMSQARNHNIDLSKALLTRMDNWDSDSESKRATTMRHLRKVAKKKELLPPDKGDWQCKYCKWSNTCYTPDRDPRKVSM